MIKYIFLLLTTFAIVLPVASYAQEDVVETEDPVTEVAETEEQTTDTSEEDAIKKKIVDLKERLATRVAEIQEQNQRAFFGVIKEKSDSKFTLLFEEEEQLVALDPNANVFKKDNGSKKQSDSLDSLELGQTVSVFGTLDLDQKTLVTTDTIVQEMPKKTHGTVKEVDTDANTFTVDGNSGVTVLDYEISTRCSVYENDEIDTCGLSKIQVGDMVFIRMIPEDDDLTSAKAVRVLLIPSDIPSEESETDEVVQEEVSEEIETGTQ